jgi:hypothetical protein
VRTGQNLTWIWLLIIGGPLGAAIYFVAVMLPDLTGGRTARKVKDAAKKLIDPEGEYKQALAKLDETPTTDARMRAAQAAAAIGRWQDAERLWAGCAEGRWAEDPTILFGHARALLEIDRFDEALKRLEQLKALGRDGETPQAALAFARAYEGLGRLDEAEDPYRYAADHVPGLEAGARYVAFMAKTGRLGDAEIGLGELDRRLQKISPALRGEARAWRDRAAKEIAAAAPRQA